MKWNKNVSLGKILQIENVKDLKGFYFKADPSQ